MQRDTTYSFSSTDMALRRFMTAVYAWMAIGVFTSGIVAYITASNLALLTLVQRGFYFFIIGELLFVFFFAGRIMSMNSSTATLLFILFSALNGLTLSFIFLIYELGSIANIFFITAAMFGLTSAWGFFTKKDLSSWSQILFMGLIGIIIASLVNWFLKSEFLFYVISYIGVLLFTGLTAYDTQRIKNIYFNYSESGEMVKRLSIMGALHLYLDFINLFLMLLRVFGRRR